MYRMFLKRISDFIFALIGLILLSPVIVIATFALILANKGTPFFFQARPGKGEKVFKIIKFKTMNDKTDDNGRLLPDSERLTRIGEFLRKTSIDELPQLVNVLIGDMSFIGPRPLLVEYLPFYRGKEKLRHSVRPGITGLAQVTGRNILSWDEKLALDVKYVESYSLINDIHLYWKTFMKVLKQDDIEVIPSRIGTRLDIERKGNVDLK